MKDFTKELRRKGWTGVEVAARWGIKPRRLSQIAAAPTRKDLDALAGLPDKSKK